MCIRDRKEAKLFPGFLFSESQCFKHERLCLRIMYTDRSAAYLSAVYYQVVCICMHPCRIALHILKIFRLGSSEGVVLCIKPVRLLIPLQPVSYTHLTLPTILRV